MKTAIVGAGAMGSLFAYFLSKRGEEVWLQDIHPERVDKVRKEGLRVEGINGEEKVRVNITLFPQEIGRVDLVIILVKAYDTGRAAKDALPLLDNHTPMLTLQNGLGNPEKIAEVVGEERVMGGITAQGATVLGTGWIRHAGKGETIIGELKGGVSPRVEKVAELFNQAGIETKVSPNLKEIIWSKLLINVGINALTAISGLKNGELVNYPELKEIMRLAVEEAMEIVKAKGITLSYSDPFSKVEAVCRATARNISSMLQDILQQKRTEVDFINGAIVLEGEKLKIPTPTNRVLTRLVKAIEKNYAQRVEKGVFQEEQ